VFWRRWAATSQLTFDLSDTVGRRPGDSDAVDSPPPPPPHVSNTDSLFWYMPPAYLSRYIKRGLIHATSAFACERFSGSLTLFDRHLKLDHLPPFRDHPSVCAPSDPIRAVYFAMVRETTCGGSVGNRWTRLCTFQCSRMNSVVRGGLLATLEEGASECGTG